MTAVRCRYPVQGRACRRPGEWHVEGDIHRQGYCRQHAAIVAVRPGASGVIRRGATGLTRPWVDIDTAGAQLRGGLPELIEAFDAVTCEAGYARTRRAMFAQLDAGVVNQAGADYDVVAAMNGCRSRMAVANVLGVTG